MSVAAPAPMSLAGSDSGGAVVKLAMTYTAEAPPTAGDFSGLKVRLEKAGRQFLGAGELRMHNKSKAKSSWSSSLPASSTTPNCQVFLYNDLLLLAKHKKSKNKWPVTSVLFLDDFISVALFPPLGFSICDGNHKSPRTMFFSANSKEACSAWLILLNKTKASKPRHSRPLPATSSSSSPSSSSSLSAAASLSYSAPLPSPSSLAPSTSSSLSFSSGLQASVAASLPPAPPPPIELSLANLSPAARRRSTRGAIQFGLDSTDFDASMQAAQRAIDRAEEALAQLRSDFTPVTASNDTAAAKRVTITVSPDPAGSSSPSTSARRAQLVKMKGGRPATSPPDAQAELLKDAYAAAINLWQSNRQVRLLAERGPATTVAPPLPPTRRHAAAQQSGSGEAGTAAQARQLMRQDTMAAVQMMKQIDAARGLGDRLPFSGGGDKQKKHQHPDCGALYEVLYAYEPRKKFAKKVHRLQVGDVVTMNKPLNGDWAVGVFEGRKALFPLPFTRLLRPSPQSAPAPAPTPALAPAPAAKQADVPTLALPADPRKIQSRGDDVRLSQNIRQSAVIRELTTHNPRELSFMIDVQGVNLAALLHDQQVSDEQTMAAMEALLHMDEAPPTGTDSTTVEQPQSIDTAQLDNDVATQPDDRNDVATQPDDRNDVDVSNDDNEEEGGDESEEENVDEDEDEDEDEVDDEPEEITDPVLREIRAFEKETRELCSWLELEMRRKNQNPKALKNARTFADILRAKTIPFLEKFISNPDAVPVIVHIHEALSRYDREIEGAEERVGLATSRYDLRRLVKTGQPVEKKPDDDDDDDDKSGSSYSSYSDSDSGGDFGDDLGSFGSSLYSDL